MMGIKNAFLQAIASKPLLKVEVADYDMVVYIGKLSAGERAEVLAATRLTDAEGSNAVSIQDQMCVTLRAALREPDGTRAFQNTEEDLQVIRDMDGAVVATLFESVVDFNGLGEKAIPEAVKNSDTSRN